MLDAHRHEPAFGIGLDLEPLTGFAMRIDLAARFHAMHRQEATKAPVGGVVSNRGYPGFTARGSMEQVSLSATFALDEAVEVDE